MCLTSLILDLTAHVLSGNTLYFLCRFRAIAILSTATRDGTTYTIFDFVYGVGGFTQIAVCVCDCERGALYLEGEAAKAEKIEYGARKASLSEDFVSASSKDSLVHSNAKELCRKTDE